MGIIDMHTHILYGVDDGAQTLHDSMEMIEEESDQGINEIVLTPHYGHKFGYPERSLLEERFAEIQKEAKRYFPNVTLYLGSELYYEKGITKHLLEGRALTYNGTKYVLVEFDPGDSFSYLMQAVQEFTYAGYIPVIAHVERYGQVVHKLEQCERLVRAGACLQINTGSLLGGFFDARTRLCKELVKQGLVHIIGSDCHDMKRRSPNVTHGYAKLLKKCDPSIYDENAEMILKGNYIST